MDKDNKLVTGMFFNKKHPKAPDFVKFGIALNKETFSEWLKNTPANDKGYIKLDCLAKRETDGFYFKLNDWVPTPRQDAQLDEVVADLKMEALKQAEAEAIKAQAQMEKDIANVGDMAF